MVSDGYYSLTALPALDPPGAVPPLMLSELLERIPPGRPQRLAGTLLLGEDLLLREAFHAGEVRAVEPAVLTAEQVRGEEPLPAELEPPETAEATRALPADVVWDAYYRHAADIANRNRSEFLREWVGTEVRLRNELARTRAQALGLQAAPYQVATELQGSAAAIEPALTAWADARDPLAGMRALVAARWRWIEQQEPLYTFEADEYPAYAAKLALLHRWRRLAGGAGSGRGRAGETDT
jgi:hypothetical protein